MKIFIKILALLFIAGQCLWAQVKPDLFVRDPSSGSTVCDLYFRNPDPININNDYLYTSFHFLVGGDSIKTDVLTFEFSIANKILIRDISFFRQGQIYCSVDSFPIKDSVNWKINKGSKDSLFFQDSVLGFKTPTGAKFGRFTWHLNQEYLFRKGDVLKLLLDEPAQGVINQTVPGRITPAQSTGFNHGKKIMFLESKPGSFALKERLPLPLFDLQGKRHVTAIPERPSFYIVFPLKMQ